MNDIKQKLYTLCQEYITSRAAAIKQVVDETQEAANDETKSTAGDKFETGREMLQQEIELNLSRLAEFQKMQSTLSRIAPAETCTTAQPGALVHTDNGYYYIAISVGQLKTDGITCYAISNASPVGAKLTGLKAGESFSFNGKTITIKSII